jgi:glycopeptide antibiotics resistance protein
VVNHLIIEFKDAVWLIILSWILYQLVRFIIFRKTFVLCTEIINFVFLLSILFIISLTIFPLKFEDSSAGGYIIIPFYSIYYYFRYLDPFEIAMNIVGNILLFMPLGFSISLKFKKINTIWKAGMIGLFISFAIECIQLTMPYRWFEVDDMILNTLGTMLGYMCCSITKIIKDFISNKVENLFNN